jgi:hypothetical protein
MVLSLLAPADRAAKQSKPRKNTIDIHGLLFIVSTRAVATADLCQMSTPGHCAKTIDKSVDRSLEREIHKEGCGVPFPASLPALLQSRNSSPKGDHLNSKIETSARTAVSKVNNSSSNSSCLTPFLTLADSQMANP